MNDKLQKKVAEAIRDPKNVGEMSDADSVGTVGNSECGEMLRLWVKYKEQDGEKVIDKASFQSFGCETAIAVASLATELIQGKTAAEAMEMGADAVLVNTAIAVADDPSRMGLAFKAAVEAGRAAYEIGLGQQLGTASPTSPLTGFLDEESLKQADG